jgi:hypothetical protein
MGILDILNPATGITNIVGKVLDRVLPEDKAQKEAAQLKLLELIQNGELAQMTGQMEIDKTEAANPNMFVAGWRPFVGWCCGAAMAWNYVAGPIVATVSQFFHKSIMFVPVDTTTMMPVLLGMLGLGAYRTYEKVQDAAGNH